MPDAIILRGHPLALCYFDRKSGQRFILGQLKDCAAELVETNIVYYRDAFRELKADIRFTIDYSRFEQDVILRERPPDVKQIGLDPDDVLLEVVSEFISAPVPQTMSRVVKKEENMVRRMRMQQPDITDDTLIFNKNFIAQGRVFNIETEQSRFLPVWRTRSLSDSPLVAKSWQQIGGRQFLIESVEYSVIKPALNRLRPVSTETKGIPVGRNTGRIENRASGNYVKKIFDENLPSIPLIVANPPPVIQQKRSTNSSANIAGIHPDSEPGLVIDYVLQLYGPNYHNFTFQSGNTYEIYNWVSFDGNIVIEGGAIIRLEYGASVSFCYPEGGTVISTATAFNPAWFTSLYDPRPEGGVDSSSGWWGFIGISFYYPSQNIELSGIHFRHLQGAIEYVNNPGNTYSLTLNDCEFYDCYNAIRANHCTIFLNNVVMNSVNIGFDQCIPYETGFDGYLNNCLLDSVYQLSGQNAINSSLHVGNSYLNFTSFGPAAFYNDGGNTTTGFELVFDNLDDLWELAVFGVLDQTEYDDYDGDDLTNGDEYIRGTDPTNWDSDGDGMNDSIDQLPLVPENNTDYVWIDDYAPGDENGEDGEIFWNWVEWGYPYPVSGTRTHISSFRNGVHTHYHNWTAEPIFVGFGDVLFTYIYIPAGQEPSEIMLQFQTLGWLLGTSGVLGKRFNIPN